MQRRLPEEAFESGAVRRADTLEELAREIGVDPNGLARTVQRFNEYAVKGLDPDFGRGQSAYNDCLGDPGHKPNAALGPLDRAPYYATEIYPGDVGTCGGLITNEHAQVLDETRYADPGSVRDRQRHRDGDGPHLSGRGREHREHDGLRLRRGPTCRGPENRRLGTLLVLVDEIPWLQA